MIWLAIIAAAVLAAALVWWMDRVQWLQRQVAHLRKTERNPINFCASSSVFLAEIDRMQLEIREYLSSLPSENTAMAGSAP